MFYPISLQRRPGVAFRKGEPWSIFNLTTTYNFFSLFLEKTIPRARLEPWTFCLENRCSDHWATLHTLNWLLLCKIEECKDIKMTKEKKIFKYKRRFFHWQRTQKTQNTNYSKYNSFNITVCLGSFLNEFCRVAT